MTVEATYNAVRSRLETTLLPVHDTALVTPEDKLIVATYLILFAPLPDDLEEQRYTMPVGVEGPADFDIDVRIVGATFGALLKAMDRVRSAVVGHRFQIPGRWCNPARLETGKAELDRSIKPGLWVCDTGILFTSRPGGA
jgi:hypothetical protein